MDTLNPNAKEIFNPEYAATANQFEAEAHMAGITSAVLSAVSHLDAQDPLLRSIMDNIEADETLETPIQVETLRQMIGITATFMEVQQRDKLKSAEDCRDIAITPPAHQTDSFAG